MPAASAALGRLPLPSEYEENFSYTDRWKAYLKMNYQERGVVIFDLCRHDKYLLACTDMGTVIAWDSDLVFREDGIDGNPVPKHITQVSDGPLYAIQVENNSVVVAGDDGVLFFEIDQVFSNMDDSFRQNPIARFCPHPSPFEKVEINRFVIDGNHLYAGSGDRFGCYKWDIESKELLATYKQPHGYTQALHFDPRSQVMVVGGEDGYLRIWSCVQDKLIDTINVNREQSVAGKNSISSLATTGDTWLHVGGGNASGGLLATYHAPTRSLVEEKATVSRVNELLIHDEKLLVVGSDRHLSQWNPLSLDRLSNAGTGLRVGYALSPLDHSSLIACGGVGSMVEIYQDAQRVFRFTC